MTDAAEAVGGGEPPEERTAITEPGKLMRIALMLRGMQEEVRRAPTDQAGRERLAAVHERALTQLHSVLSEDLRSELETLNIPIDQQTPTESEILVAQAQLIGWLEGLFQGIQAAIFSQQAQARQQLEQMRRPGLPPGTGGAPEPGPQPRGTGQYL
ncbi:MAG: bacterial proteasome activator family protein [Actinobacteria bacterium]|nr:bacterial proteasome activator family protein [Actinomycetota bacterium]